MSILRPKANPLMFRNPNDEPDYQNKFLNVYNWSPRNHYSPALYPVKYYQDFITNEDLKFQFQIVSAITEDIIVYKYNMQTGVWEEYETISSTEITPSGWVSSKVVKYSESFADAGLYYFDFEDAGIISDVIIVHDSDKMKKRLIKVEYYNSVNDFGMVFIDGVTEVFQATAFFPGISIPTISNEISGFTPDRGGFQKTRSTPTDGIDLHLDAIHMSNKPLINGIFSMDNIWINGIRYENEETPDPDDKENVDVSDITIKLIEASTNYFMQ